MEGSIMDFNDKNAVFARVAEHLLKQNATSIQQECDIRRCKYQNEQGLRCAVGCLIPDGHLALQFDGDVSKLKDHYPDLFGPINHEMEHLLLTLQSTHDNLEPSEWPNALRSVATRYKITLPECLKATDGPT